MQSVWRVAVWREVEEAYCGGKIPRATMLKNQPISGPQRDCLVISDAAAAAADADVLNAAADAGVNSSLDDPEKLLHGPSMHSRPGKLSSSAFAIRNNTNADIKFPATISTDEATRNTRRTVRLQPDMILGDVL